MKYVMVVLLFLVSPFANMVLANDVVGNVEATVKHANCTLTAKESTTGATVIGTGAGAIGGAVAGSLLGGKSSTGWGALLGAAGGALIGHNSGDETYTCKLLVESEYGTQVVETNAEKKLQVGDSINLIQTADGKVIPM